MPTLNKTPGTVYNIYKFMLEFITHTCYSIFVSVRCVRLSQALKWWLSENSKCSRMNYSHLIFSTPFLCSIHFDISILSLFVWFAFFVRFSHTRIRKLFAQILKVFACKWNISKVESQRGAKAKQRTRVAAVVFIDFNHAMNSEFD